MDESEIKRIKSDYAKLRVSLAQVESMLNRMVEVSSENTGPDGQSAEDFAQHLSTHFMKLAEVTQTSGNIAIGISHPWCCAISTACSVAAASLAVRRVRKAADAVFEEHSAILDH